MWSRATGPASINPMSSSNVANVFELTMKPVLAANAICLPSRMPAASMCLSRPNDRLRAYRSEHENVAIGQAAKRKFEIVNEYRVDIDVGEFAKGARRPNSELSVVAAAAFMELEAEIVASAQDFGVIELDEVVALGKPSEPVTVVVKGYPAQWQVRTVHA